MTSALVGAAATVAAAAAAPTTTSLLAAAKAAIARQGAVHLEVDSKSTTVADTEKVVADLGKKSGTEAISAGVGLQDAVTIVVTPAYGYVSGNSGGLSKIVGLSSAEVKKVGSKWITLKAGSSQYTSLATDIKVSSIESVLPPAKGTTLATETIPGPGRVYVLKWATAASSSNPASVEHYHVPGDGPRPAHPGGNDGQGVQGDRDAVQMGRVRQYRRTAAEPDHPIRQGFGLSNPAR